MAKTQVILTSNIVGLGAEGDKVEVAAGYARNYLIPEGLAIPLTAANERRIEALKKRRAEREAHEYNTMLELAKSLQKLICVIKVKTGEDGKMFGAVTAGMIADELKNQFDIVLDKKKIHLEHPIKALGEYQVELHLHSDIKGVLNLRVESLNPLPEAVLAAIRAQQQQTSASAGTQAQQETSAAHPAGGAESAESVKTQAEPGKKKPRKPAAKPARATKGEQKDDAQTATQQEQQTSARKSKSKE